jgi:biopolymer transport protein ExbD
MAFDMGGKKGSITPAMNVTPLVDVVLVLLIIFMVVTPLLTKQSWMNVPPKPKDEQVEPPPTDAPPPVVLTVDAEGRTRINSEEIPREQLVARLQGMLNARADKVVFFDADSKAPYERAVEVLDAVKGGGIDTVAVLADALPQL